MVHTSPSSPSAATRPTPLARVLAFTFINSVGTGVVTSGIFFLTKQGYGFTTLQNFLLGVVLGITYILGAKGAGPLVAWLRRRVPGLSSRGVLAGLMLVGAGLCAVPLLAQRAGIADSWPIWLLVCLYSPMTGVLWPLVESFLSGGRRGEVLRRATGIWNVVWSSALIAAYVGVAPFIKQYPAQAVLVLGSMHIVALALLASFPREPAPHVHEEHEPHPPVYRDLLAVFRILLPTSYVISSGLGPYLASLMPRLGVHEHLHTVLASVWLAARVLTFEALRRMTGWHGRWWLAVVAGSALLAGFGACVCSGMLLESLGTSAALALLIAGLGLYGVGMGMTYTAAIYYALEVGQAEVDAGGTHEALIGVGYTIGPMCGLLASIGVQRGAIAIEAFDAIFLAGISVLALGAAGYAGLRVRALHRGGADRR